MMDDCGPGGGATMKLMLRVEIDGNYLEINYQLSMRDGGGW